VSSVWTIELSDAARKDIKKLGHAEAKRIIDFLRDRVAVSSNPRRLGLALTGSKLGHLWRYRVGDYRVICELHDNRLVVLVIEIGHRREIYR
jgi:mRNA interferase RelE/StbE